jgi:hypothetical protein
VTDRDDREAEESGEFPSGEANTPGSRRRRSSIRRSSRRSSWKSEPRAGAKRERH